MNRQATKRAIALGVLLCLVVVSLLSEAFVLMHSHHGHSAVSGECVLCAYIHSDENLLKRFGAAVTALLGMIGFFAAPILLCAAFSKARQTPVLLKIRLNN